MDDLYREVIIDRFKNPQFRGELDPHDISYEDDNPVCGDHIRIDVRVDENDVVTEAAFSGHGCSISQASADLLVEQIIGKPLDEVKSRKARKWLKKLAAQYFPGFELIRSDGEIAKIVQPKAAKVPPPRRRLRQAAMENLACGTHPPSNDGRKMTAPKNSYVTVITAKALVPTISCQEFVDAVISSPLRANQCWQQGRITERLIKTRSNCRQA